MKRWTDIAVVIFNKAWKWCSLYIMSWNKQFSNTDKNVKREIFYFPLFGLMDANFFLFLGYQLSVCESVFHAINLVRYEKLHVLVWNDRKSVFRCHEQLIVEWNFTRTVFIQLSYIELFKHQVHTMKVTTLKGHRACEQENSEWYFNKCYCKGNLDIFKCTKLTLATYNWRVMDDNNAHLINMWEWNFLIQHKLFILKFPLHCSLMHSH